MTTTVTTGRPAVPVLGQLERRVLSAVGCGLRDDEIAALLALPETAVAEHVARLLARLGLRDRAAAVVHAFDSGLVVPGHGPRTRPIARPAPGTSPGRAHRPVVRISVLGPLRAWQDGRPLGLGHFRQQAVLAALALCAGRTLSRRKLLEGVWGTESPAANVVPVYVYRLRKVLRTGDGPDPVIEHDRWGYRLASGAVDVDVARLEELVAGVGAAERAGEPEETVRLCSRALDLFHGEPLAGLPGPLAEGERLRLVERRIALVRRRAEGRLRLGQCSDAVAELSALAGEHPLDEPVAALLMRALCRSGRRADALTVFDRTGRRLAADLGVAPGPVLRRAREAVLRGTPAGPGGTAGPDGPVERAAPGGARADSIGISSRLPTVGRRQPGRLE